MPNKHKSRFIGPMPRPLPVEVKYFDNALVNAPLALPAANSIYPVNVIPLGSESYQRVGRKVFLKKLHVTGYIQNNATCTQDFGRILVVYDKQPNAALPTVASIIQDCNAAAVTNGSSAFNVSNMDRFSILKDYPFLIPAVTSTAGVLTNGPSISDPIKNTFNVQWNISLKAKETQFNAVNGGTIADITSGSLLIIPLANAVAGSYTFLFSTRLTYTD